MKSLGLVLCTVTALKIDNKASALSEANMLEMAESMAKARLHAKAKV